MKKKSNAFELFDRTRMTTDRWKWDNSSMKTESHIQHPHTHLHMVTSTQKLVTLIHTQTPGILLGTSGAEVEWKSNHKPGGKPKQKATDLGNHNDFEKESQPLATSTMGSWKARSESNKWWVKLIRNFNSDGVRSSTFRSSVQVLLLFCTPNIF